MAIVDIKIYSDAICPWCYIGLKNLKQAISLFQKTYPGGASDTFNLIWLPYYLDAEAPASGVSMTERIIAKNGADRATGIKSRLQRVGRAQGIEFSFNGKVGNTRDSHRLIHAAGRKDTDLQTALVERLFFDHFEKDADPSSHVDLMAAAVAAGMTRDEVSAVLQSDVWGELVDLQATEAKERGVSSVPMFEIAGRFVEGAEDASEFYEAFVRTRTVAAGADGQ